ncbi:MAG: hypothetical protein ACE5R6_02670 [Candidatus Heimdallarchaeota archaeon]
MHSKEKWLMEIVTSQKRALTISALFFLLTIVIIPVGIILLRIEPYWGTIFEKESEPPTKIQDHFELAFVLITIGILSLLVMIYLWQYHTPSGVRNQLKNLQELMSATLETHRQEYRLYLPDGSIVTVKYIPYRWTTNEFCGFQLYSSPLAARSEVIKQEALRGGFAMNQRSTLSTNCSLEEFFPRTLLLYKTIQRISQYDQKTT